MRFCRASDSHRDGGMNCERWGKKSSPVQEKVNAAAGSALAAEAVTELVGDRLGDVVAVGDPLRLAVTEAVADAVGGSVGDRVVVTVAGRALQPARLPAPALGSGTKRWGAPAEWKGPRSDHTHARKGRSK